MNREPVVAPWLRALGIERVYVLSCDMKRLTAFRSRQVALGHPLGHVQVWTQEPDISDGVRGCRYGHLGILNHAIDDALTGVLVLEDDVLFDGPDLRVNLEPELEWLHEHRPDWDAVWLGGLAPEHRGSYDQYRVTDRLVKFPAVTMTTHAYILRDNAIRVAAEALAASDAAADWAIAHALLGTVYTFMPSIAGQAAGYSVVEGSHRLERW